MKSAFFILFFIISFIASAQNTYYVSTSGNDANSGTSISSAWLTIQKAANTATAGSTVNILAGTYHEHVTMHITGLPNHYITFQNYQHDSVVVDGAGSSGWGLFTIYAVAYFKIKGLHFAYTDSTTAAYSPAMLIGNKAQFVEVHHCTFENLRNKNATGIALYGNDTTSAGLHNILIDSCRFGNTNFKTSMGVGVAGNTYQCNISNNLFHHLNSQAIALIGSDSTSRSLFDYARNITVNNNEILDVYNDTPGNYRQGILVSGARNCLLEKNKIHHCDMGINITAYENYAKTNGIVFRENLVYENYQQGLALGVYNYTASTGRIKYCHIYHNTFYQNNALKSSSEAVLFPFDSSEISNNIFYANTQNEIYYTWFYGVGLQKNVLNYNAFCSPFIDPSSIIFDWDGNYTTGFGYYKMVSNVDTNSIYADPLFINPYEAIPDFHLYNNSPVKDNGDPNFVASTGENDFYNHARIFNNRVDIGAVENQNDYAPVVIQAGIDAAFVGDEPLTIYPNPTSQSLVISSKSVVNSIQITNIFGEKMKVNMFELTTYDLRLDTYNLPSGFYFIKTIFKSGNSNMKKVVVQH